MPPTKKSVTFILHGRLVRKDRLKERFRERLSSDYELRFLETRGPGEAMELARLGLSEPADFLIAVGGDGTLHEVVNGLMSFPPADRDRIAIGFFPCGKGNDFARTMGLTRNPDQLGALLDQNAPISMDLVELRFRKENGGAGRRYVINIADLGMGATVVQKTGRSRGLMGPFLTYMGAILRTFCTYRRRTLRWIGPDYTWEGPVLSLCMANGRFFGGGLCIAPRADPSDGWLDLVILGRVTVWDYLVNLGNLKNGRLLNHPEVRYDRVRRGRVESLDGDCPLEVDGEFVGYAPVDLEIHKGIFKFLGETRSSN